MLNRSQLLQQMHARAGELFIDYSADTAQASAVWERIASDGAFIYAVRAAQPTTQLLLPTWNMACGLAQVHAVAQPGAYRVISVDGSQIYPDRHQGTSCFLINVGAVTLAYGLEGKGAELSSWPTVYSGHENSDLFVSADWINAQREEAEFHAGVELATQYAHKADSQLLLFDGSLIFWHLESQDARLRDRFLPIYLASLQQLYEKRQLVASYISAPRNRELVNLIKLAMLQDGCEQEAQELHIVDAHVAHFFLHHYTRSTVFKNHAVICAHYPPALQPHFFYLHVGDEIGRVEIPAWIAADVQLVDQVASIIVDQARKGYGYPVAIAEAHEQAVVKGADRDFFYQALNSLSVTHKRRILSSQKSIKKRRASF